MRCKCKNGLMERSVKPEHVEDLGGLVVKVLNAVVVQRCSACGDEMVGIPDMQGLARAAAMARAQSPERLAGNEVRFIRRALDMKQKDFAAAMDLSAEHVSRWENNHNGIGGASEKLVRHNVCALLSDGACEYDPKAIANMIFVPFPEGGIAPIEMVRVRTPHRTNDEDDTMWSEAA
ncbi:MAG: type II TA system antitoxin MqsA family protein [Bradyrhizobium sp.]